MDLVARETTAAQSDDVEAREVGTIANAAPQGITSFSIADMPPM